MSRPRARRTRPWSERARGRGAVLACVVAVALLLVACTVSRAEAPRGGTPTSLPPPTMSSPVPSEPAADPRLQRFYGQEVTWQACEETMECATVAVPVDWAEPKGPTLDLALVRLTATDADSRLGSLLLNPGGPGVSGVGYLTTLGRDVVSEKTAAGYDLVGFDPRGVGASDPVDCLPDERMDEYLAFSVDSSTPEGLAAATAEAERFAAACAGAAGPLLGHVDTVSVARDLDVLRAVLGDDHIAYLGGSYGTFIGAEYADLFPQRVGRLVLDGAIDPALTMADVSLGQAVGMENALRAYATACLAGATSGECPLRGTAADALDQIGGVLEAARERPLRTDSGRDLTVSLAFLGIITPLYDDGSWPVLDEALAAALKGNGTELLRLADFYADRTADGSYDSNLLEAFPAVNCLDYPADDDPASMASRAAQLKEAAPTIGPYFAYGDVACAAWDAPPAREPGPVRAAGAAPILVVGTTGDPATPYEWAQSLADQLESGRLLTFEGEGHTAYLRSDCVTGAVDGYLVDGVLPGEGATC